MATKTDEKKGFIHEINGKKNNNVGMGNGRYRDRRRQRKQQRNMNKRQKHAYKKKKKKTTYRGLHALPNVKKKKKHFREKIICLTRTTGILHDCRDFRKNTMGVPDGLMCGGINRHAAKEFRKSTMGNESWAIFK